MAPVVNANEQAAIRNGLRRFERNITLKDKRLV